MRPRTVWTRGAVALLALFLGSAVAAAPRGDSFVLTIPPGPYGPNEVLNVLFIGPDNGEFVTHSTLDLTWISDGSMAASELFLEFSFTTETGNRVWSVTGADLGWGSGAGTFTGTIDTDDLDGVADHFLFPHSTIDFCLDRVGGGGVTGSFMSSTLTMELGTAPVPAVPAWGLVAMSLALAGLGARFLRARA